MLILRRFSLRCAAFFAVLALAPPSLAQHSSPHATYTLRAQVREVLTDVTVTDANGNPVTGLPQSAFHVYDDSHPQNIQSFTDHAGANLAVLPASTAPGAYTNRYLAHPPAVFNVALINVDGSSIVDQMFLAQQLIRLVKKLPPTEPLAIYAITGPHIVLMQNFTANRAALLQAVRRTVPRLDITNRRKGRDAMALYQLAGALSQYPGRKNVLWFTDGTNLHLYPGSGSNRDYGYVRPLYNTLQDDRIALYPIDLRGLTVERGQAVRTLSGKASKMVAKSLRHGAILDDIHLQHTLMIQAARSTGGHAYISNNSFASDCRHLLNHSADFYTIVYAPNDIRRYHQWHNVRITVAGDYHLSYRHGYYANNSGFAAPPRSLLLARKTSTQPPLAHSRPILFQAQLIPASTAQRSAAHPKIPNYERAYTVHFILPAADFHPSATAPSRVTVSTAAVVIDNGGVIVGNRIQNLQLKLNTAQLRAHPHGHFAVAQTIAAPNGHNHLYLAVWNTSTGRLGTLQIPLTVKRR